MVNHTSAREREETPRTTRSAKKKTLNLNGTSKNNISDAIKRRTQALIKNRSVDASSRAVLRYGLETNDPWLSELVRRADAGETIIDNMDAPKTLQANNNDSSEEKIEALAAIICRAGDEPAVKSAALLVLMATLENAAHPKALANTAKHFAFTRCGELNLNGMVDAQIAVLEGELLARNALVA